MPCRSLKDCAKYAEMVLDSSAVDCANCPDNQVRKRRKKGLLKNEEATKTET